MSTIIHKSIHYTIPDNATIIIFQDGQVNVNSKQLDQYPLTKTNILADLFENFMVLLFISAGVIASSPTLLNLIIS